jgi:mRNA-degrading endonuclease toxin of MazEF toxin-antitoxin module
VSNDVNNISPLIVLVVPAVLTSDLLAPTGIRVAAADCGYSTDIVILSRQPRALDASRFTGPTVGTVPAAVMAIVDVKLITEFDLKP